MVQFSQVKILGRWNEGFALDYHSSSSTFVGDDEFGHPRFETVRTPMGDLLYRLKNRGDLAVVGELAETAASFVRNWNPGVSIIIPVPPSPAQRLHQPVALIGSKLAELLGLEWDDQVIVKTKETPQLKNVFDLDKRNEMLKVSKLWKLGATPATSDRGRSIRPTRTEPSPRMHSAGSEAPGANRTSDPR